MRRYINTEWQDYLRRVIPKEADVTQIEETRRAFFAGAIALKHIITREASDDPEFTAQDDQLARDLDAEIEDYGASMAALGATIDRQPRRTH